MPFIYFMFIATVGIITFFRMRSIIESKGETLNYLFPYTVLFERFYRIIKREKNPILKRQYKWIFWTQVLLIPSFIGGMILIMSLV